MVMGDERIVFGWHSKQLEKILLIFLKFQMPHTRTVNVQCQCTAIPFGSLAARQRIVNYFIVWFYLRKASRVNVYASRRRNSIGAQEQHATPRRCAIVMHTYEESRATATA